MRVSEFLKKLNINMTVEVALGKNPMYGKSESEQLEAVKEYGHAIQYLPNASEAVQLEAVKKNGDAIRYLPNASEAVQLEAVKEYGHAIRFIDFSKFDKEEELIAGINSSSEGLKILKQKLNEV